MLKRSVTLLLSLVSIVGVAQGPKGSSIKKGKYKVNLTSPPTSVAGCDSDANETAITNTNLNSVQQAQLRNRYVRAAEGDLIIGEEQYLSKIQKHFSFVYTVVDVAVLGATAAGGAVGGPAAAKAFVLSATAIAGIKSSITTNFDGGTSNTLVGKIQTDFAQNQLLLEQNLDLPYQSYDLSTACADVVTLYDSGQKVSTGSKIPARAVAAAALNRGMILELVRTGPHAPAHNGDDAPVLQPVPQGRSNQPPPQR